MICVITELYTVNMETLGIEFSNFATICRAFTQTKCHSRASKIRTVKVTYFKLNVYLRDVNTKV